MIAGRGAHAPGSPLNVPPVLASNFVLGSDRAYARDDGTPTWEAFEEVLGGLEHGVGVAFASGMAAAAAILDLLPTGAEVVLPDDCYQGSVETTIERRAAIPGQQHLPPTLLRLSVGCENVEDLWSDLNSALVTSRPTAPR